MKNSQNRFNRTCMIPKIIHYCWFGGKDLPNSALKCIESWKRYMPDYEIQRWDESNFDVSETTYSAEAYRMGKYAFVSDYARFKILYEKGGIYLDTDVEIIKPLHEIIENGPFVGLEKGEVVNPGLGMGAYAEMPVLKDILRHYQSIHFLKDDGTINYDTVVVYTTALLHEKGWTGKEPEIAGLRIYPQEYFCPLDYMTKKLSVTENTYTIHHYSASWITPKQMLYRRVKQLFGDRFARFCSKIFNSR